MRFELVGGWLLSTALFLAAPIAAGAQPASAPEPGVRASDAAKLPILAKDPTAGHLEAGQQVLVDMLGQMRTRRRGCNWISCWETFGREIDVLERSASGEPDFEENPDADSRWDEFLIAAALRQAPRPRT